MTAEREMPPKKKILPPKKESQKPVSVGDRLRWTVKKVIDELHGLQYFEGSGHE
jgi:hypothetical protein